MLFGALGQWSCLPMPRPYQAGSVIRIACRTGQPVKRRIPAMWRMSVATASIALMRQRGSTASQRLRLRMAVCSTIRTRVQGLYKVRATMGSVDTTAIQGMSGALPPSAPPVQVGSISATRHECGARNRCRGISEALLSRSESISFADISWADPEHVQRCSRGCVVSAIFIALHSSRLHGKLQRCR